jgi:hypothetical protein
MCRSGAPCLPADCCFSELALYKFNSVYWSRTKRTSSSYHWQLTCSRHYKAENNAEFRLNNNHSLTLFIHRDKPGRMVVVFTTTCAISAYSLSPLIVWAGIQLMARCSRYNKIKFVRNLRQVDGFLRGLRFPPPIKLTATM